MGKRGNRLHFISLGCTLRHMKLHLKMDMHMFRFQYPSQPPDPHYSCFLIRRMCKHITFLKNSQPIFPFPILSNFIKQKINIKQLHKTKITSSNYIKQKINKHAMLKPQSWFTSYLFPRPNTFNNIYLRRFITLYKH